MINLDRSRRCLECGDRIARDDATAHRWSMPGGPGINDSRRTYRYARHAACQDRVERETAESARRAELGRLADIRAFVEAAGISPAQISEIAAASGSPDPYAPAAYPAGARGEQVSA